MLIDYGNNFDIKKLSKYEPVPVLVERYAVLMLEVIADRDQGSLHYLATNLTSIIKKNI